jgi:hypothetical protein
LFTRSSAGELSGAYGFTLKPFAAPIERSMLLRFPVLQVLGFLIALAVFVRDLFRRDGKDEARFADDK